MNINKATKRDKKLRKRKHGMQVTGKSVFTVQAIIIKKGVKNG